VDLTREGARGDADVLGLGSYGTDSSEAEHPAPVEERITASVLERVPSSPELLGSFNYDLSGDGFVAVSQHSFDEAEQRHGRQHQHDTRRQSSEEDGGGGTTGNAPDKVWDVRYYCNGMKIRNVVVHGKNERTGGGIDLDYLLPEGLATKLLAVHILEGRELLAPHTDSGQEARLFVTNAGNPFNNATFAHYWRTLMGNCSVAERMGIQYFPPNLARTSFVEEYTSENGVGPEMWDGAAYVMGNCVNQWAASYNPSKSMKRRKTQQAIRHHQHWVEGRIEEAKNREDMTRDGNE
jgi:hypothetical protein